MDKLQEMITDMKNLLDKYEKQTEDEDIKVNYIFISYNEITFKRDTQVVGELNYKAFIDDLGKYKYSDIINFKLGVSPSDITQFKRIIFYFLINGYIIQKPTSIYDSFIMVNKKRCHQ